MIRINTKADGENTYIVTLGKTALYQASACDENKAKDIVADYLVSMNSTEFYYDALELQLMAERSKYKTVEAFANAYKLTRCGTNGIYLEITSVKGGV